MGLKKIFIAILLQLLIFGTLEVRADYQFVSYDMSHGLSQNSVFSIAQDNVGFIWLGTKRGVNRYDGRYFRHYFTDKDRNSLSSVNILCLDQDGLMWMGTNTGLYVYDIQSDAFNRFTKKAVDGTAVGGEISHIIVDGSCVYFSTQKGGIFSYDTKTERLLHVSSPMPVTSMAVATNHSLWVGVFGNGLYVCDKELNGIRPYLDKAGNRLFEQETVTSIIQADQSQLFVSTERSIVNVVDVKDGNVTRLLPTTDIKMPYTHKLLLVNNEVWAATENGLYICKVMTGEVEHYQYEAGNPYGLSDNPLQTLFCDRTGGIWIGSYFGGVNYTGQMSPYEHFFPRLDKAFSLSGRRVRDFAEDANGLVWVGTEDGGLNRYNPESGEIYPFEESRSFHNIHSLCVDKDRLWVGTFGNGIRVIDINANKIVETYTRQTGCGLLDNDIFSISKSHSGRLYFGTLGGICYLENGRFEYIDGCPHELVFDMHVDGKDRLWAAYYLDGVVSYSLKTGKLTRYNKGSNNYDGGEVYRIVETRSGDIWLATESGAYHLEGKVFVKKPLSKNASQDVCLAITEDLAGNLWFTTGNGLICYNTKNGNSQLYPAGNGIDRNNFNNKSLFCTRSGRIIAGSLNGFISFMPEDISVQKANPMIVATDLFVNSEEVGVGDKESPLESNIVMTHKLTLRHFQNSFAVRMASLVFDEHKQSNMEYRLKGFDDRWLPISSDNVIKYTNLPAGHYKLQVRTTLQGDQNAQGQYELDVIVKPSPLLSWWAWLIYLALTSGAVYVTWKYMTQRSRMQRERLLEKMEYEKDQELYQSKISFFTNVAHEIRTPLSLIKAPLENILKHRSFDADEKEDLRIMDRNVNRLLDLTNQLLDFRKTERDGLKMNFELCNVNKILEGVYERFTTLMREKKITSTLTMPDEPVRAYVDRESLTKIISNLTNNAVKYCEHIINVELRRDGDNFVIVYTNDGQVVSRQMRDEIFAPFVRGKNISMAVNGTGIGLALSRALAELHNGRLEMVDDDSMNVFQLTVPSNNEPTIVISDPEMAFEEESEDNTNEKSDCPWVLVVEDNPQMQQYEKQKLSPYYNIITASNGEEALQMLQENEVDIIVSDAMMEPMGGFELCRRVKQDVKISHIPLILLTALTLDSAKIEGMEAGADSYIEKPFSMDYLLSTIKNLLKARQSVKTNYATSPFLPMETVAISHADEEFLARLKEVMDKNLTDSDFDIQKMAEEMCMSRTGLNRKLRGVLNLTPNNYIKIERLKKAAYLMKTQDYKVNEVCYKVGFTSPSYFTQCFYKQFGLLPKEFINADNIGENG